MENHMFEEIEELTRTRARILDNFPNNCSKNPLDVNKLINTRLKRDLIVREVAMKRAKTQNRLDDFDKILVETDLEAFCREAAIFLKEMKVDPRLEAVERVPVVEEERGEVVCGVCQEDVVVGEEYSKTACMHRFHGYCLWKWLEERKTCPLCRFRILK